MTQAEFDKGIDGTMVPLTCEDHPDLRWSCKKVSLSKDAQGKYRYNRARRIFYVTDDKPECDCPSSKLYAVIEG